MSLFDRYKIERTLGSGGFGETFLAKDIRMPSQRYVVIKKLKPKNQPHIDEQIIKDCFKKEAAVLEKLGENHPNIPKLYEYFEHQGEFYIIQEYIEGKTLAEISPISQEESFLILSSILETLQYIHDNKIIHRDIKPENIIIRDADQQPILIDFGAVKDSIGKVKLNSGSTFVGSKIIGTRGYMAPEQSQGYPIFSSDLYSLGRTMISALTGKIPTADEIEINLLTGELEWTKYVSEIDDKLAYVLNKANQLSPNLRYQTAKEMRQDLIINSQIKTKVVNNSNFQKKSRNNSKEIPTIISSESQNQNIKTSFSFVLPQLTNNVWKLLIGGGASFAVVGIGIFTGFQWTISNDTKNLIAQAEDYHQDNEHQDCIDAAEKAVNQSKKMYIFSQTSLFDQASDWKNKCQLAYNETLLANAESFQQNGKYIEAIKESQKISGSHRVTYQKAETIISASVNTILKNAENQYDSSGDSEEAGEIVEPLIDILPQNSQFYTNVTNSMNEWEEDEKENKHKLDQARAELAESKPNWNEVYNTANSVTTTYYKKIAQPLKDQAFHGNNKSRFESAQVKYKEGNLKGAVDLVKQIPSNASVYSEASNSLSKWQKELDKLEVDITRFIKHFFEEDINLEEWKEAWAHLTIEFQSKKVNYDDLEGFIEHWKGQNIEIKTIQILKTKTNFTKAQVIYDVNYNNNQKTETHYYCLKKGDFYSYGGRFKFKIDTNNLCE